MGKEIIRRRYGGSAEKGPPQQPAIAILVPLGINHRREKSNDELA
jgi:hypothetical protein